MSSVPAAATSGAVMLVSSAPRQAPTATSEAHLQIVSLAASAPAETALQRRLASLPTLDDLEAELRRDDPDLDGRLGRARALRGDELRQAAARGAASRLAAERMIRGWTQAELAARAGMEQANISRLERPGALMRIETARRLAAALGLDDYRELLP